MDVVEPRDQADDTGFTRARRADQRHTLPRFDVQVDAAQHPIGLEYLLTNGFIAKPDILKFDLALKTADNFFSVWRVGHDFWLVQNAKYALSARHSSLQRVQHIT